MRGLSPEAKKRVSQLLIEAGKAIADSTRTIQQSEVPEILGVGAGLGIGFVAGAGILSVGAGEATGAAALTAGLAAAGGMVGGGMLAGIVVVAAPAAVLGVGGYWAVSRYKKARRREEQEAMLQDAIRKRDALLRELQMENAANADRIAYLQNLLAHLESVISELRDGLGIALTA